MSKRSTEDSESTPLLNINAEDTELGVGADEDYPVTAPAPPIGHLRAEQTGHNGFFSMLVENAAGGVNAFTRTISAYEGDSSDPGHAASPHPYVDRLKKGGIGVLSFVVFILLGATFYRYNESWSWTDCIHFTVMTATTVGYGNISPSNDGSKVFTMVYLIVGLNLLAVAIGLVASAFESNGHHKRRKFKPGTNQSKGWGTPMADRYKDLAMNLLYLVLCTAVGSIFFSFNEDASAVESIYFAIETLTTVGYGDQSWGEKWKQSTIWFNIFFMSIGVGYVRERNMCLCLCCACVCVCGGGAGVSLPF